MALARKEDFSGGDLQLSEWCKALAHPARVFILKTLAKKRACICGDLVIDLPLAQSTVSQHLKALKKAGLIQGEIVGPRSKYCINTKNFKKFSKLFGEFGARIGEKIEDQKC